MRHPPNKLPVRRGIASLEFVLVFPMLLALVCGVFLIARADVIKVNTATAARRQTWQQRPQAPASGPLKLNQNPQADEINAAAQRAVPLGPLFRAQTGNAQSRNTLVANTWSAPTVPFASLPQNLSPHTTEMSMILNGPWNALFGGLTFAFDPNTNPGMIGTSVAGQFENFWVQLAGWTLDNIDGNILRIARAPLEIALAAAEASVIGCAFGACDDLETAIAILTFAITVFHNLNEAANGRPGDGTPTLWDLFGI